MPLFDRCYGVLYREIRVKSKMAYNVDRDRHHKLILKDQLTRVRYIFLLQSKCRRYNRKYLHPTNGYPNNNPDSCIKNEYIHVFLRNQNVCEIFFNLYE